MLLFDWQGCFYWLKSITKSSCWCFLWKRSFSKVCLRDCGRNWDGMKFTIVIIPSNRWRTKWICFSNSKRKISSTHYDQIKTTSLISIILSHVIKNKKPEIEKFHVHHSLMDTAIFGILNLAFFALSVKIFINFEPAQFHYSVLMLYENYETW